MVNNLSGSPPRIRGKLCGFVCGEYDVGITPAYTGKTKRCKTLALPERDHPRVYGENLLEIQCRLRGRGSPPRIRGKPTLEKFFCSWIRITPAYTGKTLRRQNRKNRKQDHPRVYGENCQRNAREILCQGSPPRIRGKLTPKDYDKESRRITPAYTGKTRSAKVMHTDCKDHPRVYGENKRKGSLRISSLGSPPRIRGKR